MNRDAQIGIVVILIIVGLLVIIWGRNEAPETNANSDGELGLPTGNIGDTSAGGTLRADATAHSPTGGDTALLGPGDLPVLGGNETRTPTTDDKTTDDTRVDDAKTVVDILAGPDIAENIWEEFRKAK